tara:strand:+ start:3024 stop:3791 length:768 start_codon:yes stop_codon:yes gene_type:complete
MITYLFFTGGYDSTYRLCELAIVNKVKVQPIYISDMFIDNEKNKKTRRKNHVYEKKSQDKIIDKIKDKFPNTKKLIEPTIIVKSIDYDKETKEAMATMKKNKYVRRPKCQYGAMAQYCKNENKKVELCAEIGGHFEKKLGKYVTKEGDNYVFDVDKNKDLKVFENFYLPLIKMTKHDMLQEAKTQDFDSILNNTWSCWYPKNGKHCGKCIMCKERIVPYKEHFTMIKTKKNEMIYLFCMILLLLILGTAKHITLS